MPRKRLGVKRRRTGRRTYKRGGGTGSIARRALSLAKRAFSTREIKMYETNGTVGIFPGTNILDVFYAPFENIARGTQDNQRIGDQVMGKTLEIRGALRTYEANGTLSNLRANTITFWCAVFRQADIVASANDLTRLFQNNGAADRTVYALKNWDHRFNSKIIMRKTYVVDNTNRTFVPFHYRIKVPYRIQWDQTSTFINHNRIYYGWISNSTTGVVGGTYAMVDHQWRITYTDP